MDFLSLITAVPSMMSAFGGKTTDPYKKKKEEINAALVDTNNPLYQQLYGQYRQQGASQLSQGIAELQRQNRVENRMGRTPLLSNERGGESLFRGLMQGYQGLGTQADQQTRSALQRHLENYQGMTQPAAQANAQHLDFYQGIQDILQGNSVRKPEAPKNDQIGELLKAISQRKYQPNVWSD